MLFAGWSLTRVVARRASNVSESRYCSIVPSLISVFPFNPAYHYGEVRDEEDKKNADKTQRQHSGQECQVGATGVDLIVTLDLKNSPPITRRRGLYFDLTKAFQTLSRHFCSLIFRFILWSVREENVPKLY